MIHLRISPSEMYINHRPVSINLFVSEILKYSTGVYIISNITQYASTFMLFG